MDKNIAIEFENVGKQYRLGLVGTGSLQHDINRWWQTSILGKEDPYLKIGEVNDRSTKGHSDYVWALKDISFKVEQGDVVGIIGKNGAGKSTLLKLLSHITAPSTGHIRYRGRIASLLEVGTGFHPEMTGRENIYMNGSIMGMSKSEIDRKLDEIVDFAGVERYLDTPTKRYSSGMTVRLGFAVAAFLEPEILVVDEVLTVGDAEFQKKAIGKMGEVSSQGGRTVLFVSHNMAAVKRLCQKGIVLKDGQLHFKGTADDAISEYISSCVEQNEILPIAEMPRLGKCNKKAKFVEVIFLNERDEKIVPCSGKFLKIRIFLKMEEDLKSSYFSMGVYDMYGSQILSMPSLAVKDEFYITTAKPYIDLEIPRLPLTEGTYHIGFSCDSQKELVDFVDSVIKMDVEPGDFYGYGRTGFSFHNGRLVMCDYNWNY